MCIEANNRHNWNKQMNKQTKITINRCNNKEEQKWVVDHEQQIRARSNQDWCLVRGGSITISDLQGITSTCSSSAPDDKYCLANALNTDPDTYWMSNLNEEHVFIQFHFMESTIRKLIIKWKYKPRSVEVKVLLLGLWESVYSSHSNDLEQTELDIGIDNICGL